LTLAAAIKTTNQSQTEVDGETNDKAEVGDDRAHCYQHRIRYVIAVLRI